MELGRAQIVRTVKRLAEAIGYLELGMTQRALDVLEGIEEPGPFTAVAEMLRGEAARLEDRLPDAVYSFEKAARMLAAPDNKSIWYALSQFHLKSGDIDAAIETLSYARGVRPRRTGPKTR